MNAVLLTDYELLGVFRRTRARIATPGQWTQGATAREHMYSQPIAWDNPRARSWCAMGAAMLEAGASMERGHESALVSKRINMFFHEQLSLDLMHVNDTQGLDAALAALDKGIALLEERVFGEKRLEVGVDVPAFTREEQKQEVSV